MESRKTDMFIWGVIIVIISIALMAAFPPQSATNPYAPYICHGNITDTTPFYDIIFIIMAAIGICMIVYTILTDLSEDSEEEDIWN